MYLTEKQEQVLKFIEEYQLEYGKSPTIKEMKEYFQVKSDNSIIKVIKALEEKKMLQKDNTPRGIKLLNAVKQKFEKASEVITLPLLGEIPAGGPTLSEENIVDFVSVGDIGVRHRDNSFLLRVRGDSMEDAGIFEGDLVIVDQKLEPKYGNIVVALVDNGNTVKRFMKDENGHEYLKPENQRYGPI
ncbi:repressor LexA, partial [Candidatus Peregrinibacteria bacterium RIFOXYC2_FULL_33_13]